MQEKQSLTRRRPEFRLSFAGPAFLQGRRATNSSRTSTLPRLSSMPRTGSQVSTSTACPYCRWPLTRRIVRNGPLVMEAGPDIADGPWFYRRIRTERWLFIEYEQTDEFELYDMANDPYQLQSLHADPAYDRQRLTLADQLSALRDCAGEACRPGSLPDASHRDPHPDAETDAAPAAEDAQSSSTLAIGGALAARLSWRWF